MAFEVPGDFSLAKRKKEKYEKKKERDIRKRDIRERHTKETRSGLQEQYSNYGLANNANPSMRSI